MENSEKTSLTDFVKNLENRVGTKPATRGPAPHQQVDQFPKKDDFADELHDYTMTFEGVINGESHIGDGGLRAYFIKSDSNRGFEQKFLVDNEFAHIHRHGSKSLHIALPPEIGQITDQKGWTENHPLAVLGRIPNTNFMLFGARSKEELEVSKVILRISYLHATKQW
ncbi:MAG: hypothetical protein ACRCVT_04560 [Leadbetterella sp.]